VLILNNNNNNDDDVHKLKNLVTLVDVSIPADKKILEKEEEKITKYQDSRIEI